MFSKKFSGKAWGIHYNQLFKTFRTILSEWEGFENIEKKIVSHLVYFYRIDLDALNFPFKNKHGNTIYESCCNAMECNLEGFNVLNHGDTWVTNILFTEDVNLKKDIQLVKYYSNVIILMLFKKYLRYSFLIRLIFNLHRGALPLKTYGF